MTPPGKQTTRTRLVCRTIVEGHLPRELGLFDTTWDAVLRSLGTQQVEDLREPPRWRQSGFARAALAALGDPSGQVMDTLYVIGAVVGAVVTLLNQDTTTLIETADVDNALRQQALQLGAPAHVRRILEAFGTPLLAEQLAAADWQGSESEKVSATGLLRVEYCEPIWDDHGPTVAAMKTHTNTEVWELFRQRAAEFGLFVDEPEWTVFVRGTALEMTALQPRERRLLFLVLQALRRFGTVTHAQIRRDVLQVEEASSDSIRNAKSALNKKLSGMLNEIMTAEKYESRYTVKRRPYCWVRYDGTPSRLAPDLPA